MKSLRSTYCVAAVGLFSLAACGENEARRSAAIHTLDGLPARPQLAPGETTMEPRAAEKAAATANLAGELTTTAINVPDVPVSALVDALVGSGADAPIVSNVAFTGISFAGGLFAGGTDIIGFESGVVLSSGNIGAVVGPNAQDGMSTNNGLGGDAQLDGLIPGFTTFDATVLEFDFECPGASELTFRYVFTSDEYNEYVGSQFNDVFGFFVNGANVALLPGTSTPVAINTVNCGNPFGSADNNCGLYRNNDFSDGGGAIHTEMDGLTEVLTVQAPVSPGVNHIRLAIADAGDHVFDSNIFLESGSFSCNRAPEVSCQDVTVSAGASCQADASIDAGSSDPDGDALVCTQAPAAPYGLGTSADVTLTCTDPHGASGSCQADVTVVDDSAPAIVCPADQTAECVAGGAAVAFDAPGASDNCGVASTGCLPPSGSIFPSGTTPVACSTSDTSGNTAGCSFEVSVVDTTPPVVTAEGWGEIWPPNHKYVTRKLADCGVEIADACQGVVDLATAVPTITCVTSDELENANGNGDGNTVEDMKIVDATTVQLRSERAGGLDGRVYTVHFKVTDAAGNVATGACQAGVPHDQSGASAVDSGVRYKVGSCP